MFWFKRGKKFVIISSLGAISFACVCVALWWYWPLIQISQADAFSKAEFYFNVGNASGRFYDIQKAEEYYKLATAEANELVWYQLGRTHFIQGEFSEALEAFETQIDLHGDALPNVYYMVGLTHGFKARKFNTGLDWELAAKNFEKYIEYDYFAPWPRVDLAWVYFSQGRFEEMGPVLAVALEYSPDNPWVLNMYGLYVLNTEQNREGRQSALAYFEQAKNLAGDLSESQWGEVYPGNNPVVWGEGIFRFNAIINENIELVSAVY